MRIHRIHLRRHPKNGGRRNTGGHARIWPNRIWPKPHLAKKNSNLATRQPNVHISGPRPSNTTKIPREDPPEREERMKFPGREKKKARNFGPPTLRALPFRPTFQGPTMTTTRPAHDPPTTQPAPDPPTTPTTPPPHPHNEHPTTTPKNKIGQMRSGQIRSNKIGQIRPNKVGQMRPVNFGQMWYWPNSVWPNAAK